MVRHGRGHVGPSGKGISRLAGNRRRIIRHLGSIGYASIGRDHLAIHHEGKGMGVWRRICRQGHVAIRYCEAVGIGTAGIGAAPAGKMMPGAYGSRHRDSAAIPIGTAP